MDMIHCHHHHHPGSVVSGGFIEDLGDGRKLCER
jgi:hypothetical protein